MALGRSLRKTLIIDSGLPCNRQTPHSHNFITQDGENPGAIAEKAKQQVLKYSTVKFLNDLVITGNINETGFSIFTAAGKKFTGKKLVFATGIKDLMPDIRGFANCWGISVIHCPYCHGYEFRQKKTGIMANGMKAFHIASLVNNLTNNLTIITRGKADFDDDQMGKLRKHNIKIIESDISEMGHEDGRIKHVVFGDGTKEKFEVVYAAIPFIQQTDIPVALGCALTKEGYIEVNSFQQTSIHGVFACGDNTTMMRSVANAVYSGNVCGAIVNKELTDEYF